MVPGLALGQSFDISRDVPQLFLIISLQAFPEYRLLLMMKGGGDV
jgi:hypothetical protein